MTEYGSGLFLAPFKIVITALVTFPENQNLSLEDTGRGETNPSQILDRLFGAKLAPWPQGVGQGLYLGTSGGKEEAALSTA